MARLGRAQVDQKDAALKQAQVDLDHTTIRAPVDGVVVSRAVDVGQTVAASLQAPTLFTIAQDLTKMQVETSVDEADIGRIKLDDRATFTVDAFPGETFAGVVTQIRKAAQVVQNVVTYTVVVGVDNPAGKLLPGMTANVKLVVAEKPSVLKVPNAALRFRPAGVDAPAPSASAPGAAAGGGGGPPSIEQIRERLVKGLGLTEAQQAKLDPILQEGREQMRGLQGLPDGERRPKAQKIREAPRVRIREILTDEQKPRYDEMTAAAGEARSGTAGRVWVLGPDGKPAPLTLMLGISDGASTEVLRGDVREGQEVIVGVRGHPRPPAPARRAASEAVAVAGPIIATEGLTKDYHLGPHIVHALRGVSVTIDRGEFVAVMGPSGSGKSTFMNLLGCLDTPSAGRYELDGEDVAGLSARRARPDPQHEDRLRLPAVQSAAAHDRARERRAAAPLRRALRARAAGRARSNASPPWASPTAPATIRASSRAASSSASPSPARWSTTRRSFSPTSPPATSTPAPASRSSRSSRGSTAPASRSCS